MPRADNILDHLPSTFRAVGGQSALRAIADAVGGELQHAENSLADVMQSHWVEFADLGVDEVRDLACIGSLYGLAPRPDETVEEFREHLLRHVRIFLDGTVTVPGLLRTTAAALGLGIEEPIDPWWEREHDVVTTTRRSGADAASLVGLQHGVHHGADPAPAQVVGSVLLDEGVDLRDADVLRVALDGGGSTPIALSAAAVDPAAVLGDEVVAAINSTLGGEVAALVGGHLRLRTTSAGPDAQIDIADGPRDAAPAVLGLAPRTFRGQDATPARIVGEADLSNPVDLTSHRFLRVDIDGTHLAEVDLAAAAVDPGGVAIDQVVAAINDQLGITAASHDGATVTLTSPTVGAAGYVMLLTAAAQDAAEAVFGPAPRLALGQDDAPAEVVGTTDLGPGVDLTSAARLRLAVDGEAATTVDVAGADPISTGPDEIATSINTALGATVAHHDGRHLALRSPTVGGDGVVAIEPVDEDAAPAVLGVPLRRFNGTGTRTAATVGTVDLADGVNLAGASLLWLSLDDGPVVEVDLLAAATDPTAVTLDELAQGIDGALDAAIATDDGAHLLLVSPTDGAAGAIGVHRVTTTTRRRFLSHALVTDDAGTRLFGFTARTATGTEPTRARLVGDNDLLAGADLRERRRLRVRIDDGDPVEVDCAGPRPRATTPATIVGAINAEVGADVASTDGHVVTLVSRIAGAASQVVLEPTRARDAAPALGLVPGGARGVGATGVGLTGTRDLSAGIDLPADATLSIGVDGAVPVEVAVGDDVAPTRTLGQLAASLNVVLEAGIASHDGIRLHLQSPTSGPDSSLQVATPATGTDVTSQVLGVTPRTYHGTAATAAVMVGTIDLGSDPADGDLVLRVAVDDGQAVDVRLADAADDPSTPTASEVATAINVATDAVAAIDDGRLRLASPTTGPTSRLEVQHADTGDAREAIFGSGPHAAFGEAAGPAVLTGTVDLLRPVDLSDASIVRVSVDGDEPVDVDVAGGTPSATGLIEVVAALDRGLSASASATTDDRLQLTSPTTGAASSLELVALRRLELQEYPPAPRTQALDVHHGTRAAVDNNGAAPGVASIEVTTPVGVVGPAIAAVDRGWGVRVEDVVPPGASLTVHVEGGDVAAVVALADGTARTVDPDAIEVTGPPGEVLALPRGRTLLSWLECDGARFDAARLDHDWFAGGTCEQAGVFDASSFVEPDCRDQATFRVGPPCTVFGGQATSATSASLALTWEEHRAGALVVNLPADLDERFGARFDLGRFGSTDGESFPGVVTEPDGDPAQLQLVVNAGSGLVEAHLVPRVPIGWSAVEMPFRDPQPLTNGSATREASLYLAEEGLGASFIELRARHVGTWANAVTVRARQSGPAIYDLEVAFPGARFENARATVAGWPPVAPGAAAPRAGCGLAADDGTPDASPTVPQPSTTATAPTLAAVVTAPSTTTLLAARAAGVQAAVSRDRTVEPDTPARAVPGGGHGPATAPP